MHDFSELPLIQPDTIGECIGQGRCKGEGEGGEALATEIQDRAHY